MKNILLISGLLIATAGIAQPYSVDWFKISGGGGNSTGGVYIVSGTIGQPDAGPMSGGNYSLTGGFWALVSVVQTPGAPPLQISYSANSATVYWPVVSGWSLVQNSNLNHTNGWSDSAGVTNAGGTNYLTIPNPAGNLFFRLSQ